MSVYLCCSWWKTLVWFTLTHCNILSLIYYSPNSRVNVLPCSVYVQSCVPDKIVECNPGKFQASIARPEMEKETRRRRSRAVARVHIDGMTCNKCVNFIQSKVRNVRQ